MVERNTKMTPQELVLAAVAAIFTDYDLETAKGLLAPDYIQHNVAVPTGADPILGFIPALEESGIALTTHRVITEGDMVVLQNTYENAQALGAGTLVAFDVFRVADGATKPEVKAAIELLFKTKVRSVTVSNVKGKVKRFGRRPKAKRSWKKAVVTRRPGDKIEMFASS